MTKLRSKKRVTSVLVALVMAFVVGAAFAATPGLLTITGVISIDQDLLLEFTEVTANPAPPLGTGFDIYFAGTAVRQPGADGRPNQTILFTVDIQNPREPGTATLDFSISNTGQMDAQLAAYWDITGDDIDTVEEYIQAQLDAQFGIGWFDVAADMPYGDVLPPGSSLVGHIMINYNPRFGFVNPHDPITEPTEYAAWSAPTNPHDPSTEPAEYAAWNATIPLLPTAEEGSFTITLDYFAAV